MKRITTEAERAERQRMIDEAERLDHEELNRERREFDPKEKWANWVLLAVVIGFLLATAVAVLAGKAIPQAAYDSVNHEEWKG